MLHCCCSDWTDQSGIETLGSSAWHGVCSESAAGAMGSLLGKGMRHRTVIIALEALVSKSHTCIGIAKVYILRIQFKKLFIIADNTDIVNI